VDALGYKFTPDEELKDFLLEQEVALERKHGIPFCPCQPIAGERAHDMTLVCPCIPFHRAHDDAMKRCWCGLFAHKDVTSPAPPLVALHLGNVGALMVHIRTESLRTYDTKVEAGVVWIAL
jgi:ferredoxin-thioredoxin reductase catalytic subunit